MIKRVLNNEKVLFLVFVFVISLLIICMNWNTKALYGQYRTDQIQSVINTIKEGEIPEFLAQNIHSYGWSLYLPYIAVFFHIEDLNLLFLGIQMLASFVMLIAFSIEMYILTKSYKVSAAALILLHIFCGSALYGFKTQTYWAAGWATVMCFPLVLIYLSSDNQKQKLALMALIGMICSIANVMRNQNAFLILVITIIAIFVSYLRDNEKRLLTRTLFIILHSVIFYIMYNIISVYIPLLLGIITHRKILNNGGFVWHSILAGLGVFENKYGLKWNDGVIMDLMGYSGYSNEYLETCRNYFMKLLIDDPAFVLTTWIRKFCICIIRSFRTLFAHPYEFGEYPYFIAGKLCFKNILIPSILGFTLCFIIERKHGILKQKEATKKLSTIILILFAMVVIGTVQGVIGYCYYIMYYMGTIVSIGLIPLCFIILYITELRVCEESKEDLQDITYEPLLHQDTTRLLSFVIPAYNEADSLPELCNQIIENINNYKYEILIVNDGSTDDTEKVSRMLHENNQNIHLINFRKNMGKARALSSGFHYAKGDIIITMDADLQDDPKEIPRFIERIGQGFDLVSGWKVNRLDSAEKRLPSKIFNYVTSKLSGVELHDHDCGYKAYRREVVESLNLYGEFHRYIPVLAWREGFKISEITVEHHKRQHGKSKYGIERYMRGFLIHLQRHFY